MEHVSADGSWGVSGLRVLQNMCDSKAGFLRVHNSSLRICISQPSRKMVCRKATYFIYLFDTLQMKSWWESNINVLFGISFTLKTNKKLTKRINCFHSMICNFQNWNFICWLYIYVNSRFKRRRGGESRELPPNMLCGSSLLFSQLLRFYRA
jgi:hypothetical protein